MPSNTNKKPTKPWLKWEENKKINNLKLQLYNQVWLLDYLIAKADNQDFEF